MSKSTAERNREIASGLSDNLPLLLREFTRDFEHRIYAELARRGHPQIRASHSAVFANLGRGAVRVTELAERARVTQQAMGKMLKELERMGYVARDVDSRDKRAREIRLTESGMRLAEDCVVVVGEVRDEYARRIGGGLLDQLESGLREAIHALELEQYPDQSPDTAPGALTAAP